MVCDWIGRQENRSWFVKIRGEAKQVRAERETFRTFLKSLKLTASNGAGDGNEDQSRTQTPRTCRRSSHSPPVRSHSTWGLIVRILTPLASLRLTVVLFLMAIFIVFAGTLAQTEKDIWQVVHDYFRMDLGSPSQALRSAFAWIDFRIFFPRSFFPEMNPIPWGYGFWFPSGWLIGFVMFLNLTAAHLIRFEIEGKGKALAAGLVIVVVGILLAIAVIAAGSANRRLFSCGCSRTGLRCGYSGS